MQEQQNINGEDIIEGRQEDRYSPTSPLDIQQLTDALDALSENNLEVRQQIANERSLVMDIPDSAPMFAGKRRRDAPCSKSQSLETFFRFEGDEFQARFKRRKKRMEEWDANGGGFHSKRSECDANAEQRYHGCGYGYNIWGPTRRFLNSS